MNWLNWAVVDVLIQNQNRNLYSSSVDICCISKCTSVAARAFILESFFWEETPVSTGKFPLSDGFYLARLEPLVPIELRFLLPSAPIPSSSLQGKKKNGT